MNKTLLFLVFVGLFALNSSAQTASYDSANTIRKAKHDASRFRLSTNDLKKFIIEHWPAASDHFKPIPSRWVSAGLLTDSLYVTTYRSEAFNGAAHQRELLIRHESILKKSDSANADSDKLNKEHLARDDVKNFKIDKEMLKRSKDEHFKITSDYFSPSIQTTANVNLLKDSVYVKTFREEAYYKSFNTRVHPIGHVVVITSLATAAATAFTIMMLVVARHSRG